LLDLLYFPSDTVLYYTTEYANYIVPKIVPKLAFKRTNQNRLDSTSERIKWL